MGHMMWRVLGNIFWATLYVTLTPKVKAKGKQAGICDGVLSTAALVNDYFNDIKCLFDYTCQ